MSFILPPIGCCRCECDSGVTINIGGSNGGGCMPTGVDSPEGVITADAGCQYFQCDFHLDGTTAIFWIKVPGQDGTPFGWSQYMIWSSP